MGVLPDNCLNQMGCDKLQVIKEDIFTNPVAQGRKVQ